MKITFDHNGEVITINKIKEVEISGVKIEKESHVDLDPPLSRTPKQLKPFHRALNELITQSGKFASQPVDGFCLSTEYDRLNDALRRAEDNIIGPYYTVEGKQC